MSDDVQDSAGVQYEWEFEVGDVVTNKMGDRFKVKKRLIDVDANERHYRLSHTSNSVSMFGKATEYESGNGENND